MRDALVAQGLAVWRDDAQIETTNKRIAADLYLSPRTVQHHVAHIYDKIDRRTRAGAAMLAMEHRLL